MENKKMTKKDYYATLLALDEVKSNPDLVSFINHEIDLLAKKASGASDKPTAKQKENANYKVAILSAMEDGKSYTITEMSKTFTELADLSPNRISALVTQLKNEGKVVRTEEKRVAYFSKAQED